MLNLFPNESPQPSPPIRGRPDEDVNMHHDLADIELGELVGLPVDQIKAFKQQSFLQIKRHERRIKLFEAAMRQSVARDACLSMISAAQSNAQVGAA